MHSDAEIEAALERFSVVGQETGVLAAASR
jgi:hypothetical protein